MSLDPTASEFFFRSSIKKYLIDNLSTTEGVLVVFDKTILYEVVSSYGVNEWLVINFGAFNRSFISKNTIEINCCTRKDAEGVNLSKLGDKVIEYLTDISTTDTMRRITLYDATDANPTNWTDVGTMLVTQILEGAQRTTADQTKVKTIHTILSWGTII